MKTATRVKTLQIMKQLVLFFVAMVTFSPVIYAQSKMGDVASIYVTTTNLDSSVAFYQKIGFTKTGSNDFPSPWAQVSDGSLLITMRKDKTPYIGLTYYSADVDQIAAQLEKDGVEFTQRPKESDPIKRYYIKEPNGFNVVLSANPGGFEQPAGVTLLTMKPADFNSAEKYPNKQCGAFGEFAFPVTDINVAVAFWKKLGFKASASMTEPYPHVILTDGHMIIGLHQTKHFTTPAVTYFGMNVEKRIQQLKQNGLQNFTEVQGKNNVAVKTWEGQSVFIFSLGM
jgi:predicted lactoylglutathione lyase